MRGHEYVPVCFWHNALTLQTHLKHYLNGLELHCNGDWPTHCQSTLSLALWTAICYFFNYTRALFTLACGSSFFRLCIWLMAFSRIITVRVAQPLFQESGPSPLLQQGSFPPQPLLLCSCCPTRYNHHSLPRRAPPARTDSPASLSFVHNSPVAETLLVCHFRSTLKLLAT